jgi:hypothetical protein
MGVGLEGVGVLGWVTKPYKPNFNKTEKNGVSFCMQECCS